MRHVCAYFGFVALFLSSSIAGAADPADAVATPATVDQSAAETPAEVVKTKTKSNQSNDKVATPASDVDTTSTEEPAEVVKTKTKSNQSND